MGCDIHAHFEIKVNNKWIHWSQPNIKRNYDLFAKMAGIRNEDRKIKPIFPSRGLPKDTTETARLHSMHWGTDGHSHSWLSSYEVVRAIKFHESKYNPQEKWEISHEQWGYLFGNGWDAFHEYRKEYPEFVQDFRLVFWFDN